MASDNSREAAVKALGRCRRNGAFSSAAIDAAFNEYKLNSRAKALAMRLTLGVLQNMTLCDYYIDCFCSSPSKIEPRVRDILREAVYQLVFMDKIPQNAAVNEAVELCKKLGQNRAAGFTNAVLRKIAACVNKLPEPGEKGTAGYLSVKYSHPLWLAEELIKDHGYDFTESFFAADNSEPAITIQVNTLRSSTEKLLALLGDRATLHPWLPDCICVSGNPAELPGYKEGFFYVQDPAAKCAVLAASPIAGMKVLDACAAPGGKSFAAAILMGNEGSILSCDIHEKKLGLIKDGASRLGIETISTKAVDARTGNGEVFDCVIADVPCSGYGVIRKKPEIRYKPENERHGLPEIQRDILEKLSESVKPGGVLMYSTCTVFSRENEEIVRDFLARHSEYISEDFSLPDGSYSENGMLTLWPHINGTDGFFMAKLRRRTI